MAVMWHVALQALSLFDEKRLGNIPMCASVQTKKGMEPCGLAIGRCLEVMHETDAKLVRLALTQGESLKSFG